MAQLHLLSSTPIFFHTYRLPHLLSSTPTIFHTYRLLHTQALMHTASHDHLGMSSGRTPASEPVCRGAGRPRCLCAVVCTAGAAGGPMEGDWAPCKVTSTQAGAPMSTTVMTRGSMPWKFRMSWKLRSSSLNPCRILVLGNFVIVSLGQKCGPFMGSVRKNLGDFVTLYRSILLLYSNITISHMYTHMVTPGAVLNRQGHTPTTRSTHSLAAYEHPHVPPNVQQFEQSHLHTSSRYVFHGHNNTARTSIHTCTFAGLP